MRHVNGAERTFHGQWCTIGLVPPASKEDGRYNVMEFDGRPRPVLSVECDLSSDPSALDDAHPKSSRTVQTAIIIAAMSAVSPAGTACLVFLMLTAPK